MSAISRATSHMRASWQRSFRICGKARRRRSTAGRSKAKRAMPQSANNHEATRGHGTHATLPHTAKTRRACACAHLPRCQWGQIERGVDECSGALEIEVAIDVLLHQERRPAVELLVLLMPAAELRTDEVPGKPHQRHPGFRVR